MDKQDLLGRRAELRYLDGDFEVIRPGNYVNCAVTGVAIPLNDLTYWNVERQEPYADAKAALTRYLELDSKA